MADELGGFIPYIGGPENAWMLLKVLEELAGADETVVRDSVQAKWLNLFSHFKAIESLGKIVPCLKNDEVSKFVLPMIKRLTEAEWFPRKTSAAHLIGLVYGRISSPDEQAELRSYISNLSQDDTSIVRKAVLNNLAKVIYATRDEAILGSDLYQLLAKLIQDPQDAVRLLTICPLVALGEMVKDTPEHISTMILPLFRALVNDRSWRIRFMVARHFAQIAVVLPESEHPGRVFTALLKDAEPEVRTEAASSLVHLARVLNPDEVRSLIVPCLPAIATDPSAHVKAALATGLNDLAPIVGPNTTIEQLLPLVIKLLADDASDVRLNVVTNFEKTVQVIGIDLLYDVLLPAIARLSQDPQWRVRETIIGLIPALVRLLGHQKYEIKLASMGLTWLDDPVFAVRRAAAKCHAMIIKAFGTQWALDSGLIDKLLQLATHSNYLCGQVCLLIVSDFLSEVSLDFVSIGFLLPVLEDLKTYPVPKVKIALQRPFRPLHLSFLMIDRTSCVTPAFLSYNS